MIALAPGVAPEALERIGEAGHALPHFLPCNHEEFRESLHRLPADAVYLDLSEQPEGPALQSLLAALGGTREHVVVVVAPAERIELRLGLLRAGTAIILDPEDAAEVASAACRAAIRRKYGGASGMLTYGTLSFDMNSRAIRCNGRLMELNEWETRILAHMIKIGRRSANLFDLLFHCFHSLDSSRAAELGEHLSSLRAKLRNQGPDAPSIRSHDDGSVFLSCVTELVPRGRPISELHRGPERVAPMRANSTARR